MKCENRQCDYYNEEWLFNCRNLKMEDNQISCPDFKACATVDTLSGKEQDMNDKDFRVGDKVTRIKVVRGYVCDSVQSNNHPEIHPDIHPVIHPGYSSVNFYLYHGHNVTFEVHGEELPKRTVTRYVNVCWNKLTKKVETGLLHKIEEAAKTCCGGSSVITALKIEIPEDEV